jgi:DNA-directed RNA polymerase specialized sigma24 family protein
MGQNIKISTRHYLETTGSEREKVFKEEVYPFIEEIINGVFLSLRITCLSPDDLQDIRQDIYFKVLSRFKTKGLTGIRSFKNYYFISVKNITIDYLRSFNRDKKFNEHIQEIILNASHNGTSQRNKQNEGTGADYL